ncbi:hypothetical protein CDD82_6372 [Ophiocordyceps australis]|uniref:Uncharacterized protein n=1 Tax=Ophiocordyceps australis TaxID=1399860 RepID=A0A2C5YVC1_9HYPO|nr:hypothetical protein CDD82_6372 [Ophiocordyceps australis]
MKATTLLAMASLVALIAASPMSGQQLSRRGGRPDAAKIPPSRAQPVAQPARRPTTLAIPPMDIPPTIARQGAAGPRVLPKDDKPFKLPDRRSNVSTNYPSP